MISTSLVLYVRAGYIGGSALRSSWDDEPPAGSRHRHRHRHVWGEGPVHPSVHVPTDARHAHYINSAYTRPLSYTSVMACGGTFYRTI